MAPVAPGSLFGRAAEVEEIDGLVESAARGHGRVLFVSGDAGMGKSRLVERAFEAAQLRGMRTLQARAEELDTSRPFGTIASCLGISVNATDARAREIARLVFGDLSTGAATVLVADRLVEFRLVEAMVIMLEELCSQGPVALAVDDLQWADAATLHVLHRLVRSAPDLPLFLLGAFRSVPRPPELDRLLRAVDGRAIRTVSLAPLAAADVRELVASRLGLAPSSRLLALASAAGGNPFYVEELVSALEASGSLVTSSTMADVAAGAAPSALRLSVLLQMSYLSPGVQQMLQTASVLGSSFAVDDLALVLGRTAVELMPLLREAAEANVLHEAGPRLAFRHDLLREALYEDLPGSLRASLHLHVARTLERAGASALEVAEHVVRGATRGDEKALEWLRRAADEAVARSPALTASLLERAAELFDVNDPRRDAVLTDWATCMEVLGRNPDAEVAYADLLSRRQPPKTEARLRLGLARMLNERGEYEPARQQASRAEAIPGLTATERLRVLASASPMVLFGPRLEPAEEMASRGLRRAEELGDEVARSNCAYTLGFISLQRAQFQETLDWCALAGVARDAAPADRMGLGWGHLRLATPLVAVHAHLRVDRADTAHQLLQRIRLGAAQDGLRNVEATAQVLMVVHAFLCGAWDDAVGEFEALLDLCREQVWWPANIQVAAGARALIGWHRDDPRAGDALAVMAAVKARMPYAHPLGALAKSVLAESSTSTREALDGLAQVWDDSLEAGVVAGFLDLGPTLVRLARSEGDLARAHDACDQVDAIVAANQGVETIRGTGLRCRGLLEDDPQLFVDAAAALRASPRLLDRAHACEDAATALLRVNEVEQARPLFDDAVHIYEGLDASRDLRRITGRCHSLAGRRGAREARRRPKTGWEALTRSERAVVDLVAEGLSNVGVAERLFLSRHTVKRHLANAMLKIGVSSRVELARDAARAGG